MASTGGWWHTRCGNMDFETSSDWRTHVSSRHAPRCGAAAPAALGWAPNVCPVCAWACRAFCRWPMTLLALTRLLLVKSRPSPSSIGRTTSTRIPPKNYWSRPCHDHQHPGAAGWEFRSSRGRVLGFRGAEEGGPWVRITRRPTWRGCRQERSHFDRFRSGVVSTGPGVPLLEVVWSRTSRVPDSSYAYLPRALTDISSGVVSVTAIWREWCTATISISRASPRPVRPQRQNRAQEPSFLFPRSVGPSNLKRPRQPVEAVMAAGEAAPAGARRWEDGEAGSPNRCGPRRMPD